LSIADNKRPVGQCLLPGRQGKPLAWDVTVICPLAQSNVAIFSRLWAQRQNWQTHGNQTNIQICQIRMIFQPIAFENLGAISIISDQGHTINVTIHVSAICLTSDQEPTVSVKSNDPRESIILFCLSAFLLCFSALTLCFCERVSWWKIRTSNNSDEHLL